MRLDDRELEELVGDIESDRVERKENFSGDAPDKVRQAICAFANDLPRHERAGVVFIGVRDDGTFSGLSITDDLLTTLGNIRSDGNILPLPTMLVEKRKLCGSEVAVITVAPADSPPVRFKGRTWIRTGPRRDIASLQDERVLNERRRGHDQPFDLQPVSQASLADLSRDVFETQYLPNAFSPDAIEANDRSYEERLSSCRMIQSISSPVPTVLGAIALGTRTRDLIPNAYIQFLRIDGKELHDPVIDTASIDGRLEEVITRVDDKVRANISTGVDIATNDVDRRAVDYPLAALQQLIRNAVMHRSYENTNAPIRLTWFSDRIEILSPGGPYGIVNRENFGKPGITDYRNPNLAEAMKVFGYVQRFGIGIATARKLFAENANPAPVFDPHSTHVLVTIPRSP